MPKERRQRTELHTPSAKLQKRRFAVQDNAVEHVNIGEASHISVSSYPPAGTTDSFFERGNDILHVLSAPEAHVPAINKKEKQQLKREAFLEKLTMGLSPYSKSHTRRLKRKAKEQIAGGLNDVKAAIAELEHDDLKDEPTIAQSESKEQGSRNPKISPKIGEGKGTPLSTTQRKRAVKLEQSRQPLVLSNPVFSSNPFKAIRTHARNTLVKHQVNNP